MSQEYSDYLGMIWQQEKDNHTPKTFSLHVLGLLFAAHTNTGLFLFFLILIQVSFSLECFFSYSGYHWMDNCTTSPGQEDSVRFSS